MRPRNVFTQRAAVIVVVAVLAATALSIGPLGAVGAQSGTNTTDATNDTTDTATNSEYNCSNTTEIVVARGQGVGNVTREAPAAWVDNFNRVQRAMNELEQRYGDEPGIGGFSIGSTNRTICGLEASDIEAHVNDSEFDGTLPDELYGVDIENVGPMRINIIHPTVGTVNNSSEAAPGTPSADTDGTTTTTGTTVTDAETDTTEAETTDAATETSPNSTAIADDPETTGETDVDVDVNVSAESTATGGQSTADGSAGDADGKAKAGGNGKAKAGA